MSFVETFAKQSRIKFKTIDEVYSKYPTNTLSKFKRIANRYGFMDDEAKDYYQNKVVHDQHIPPPKFMHIYSKIQHAFQMDTLIGDPDYLIYHKITLHNLSYYQN